MNLGEKYNLGKPRKRERFSKEEKIFFQTNAEHTKYIIRMGRLWMKNCKQKFGIN